MNRIKGFHIGAEAAEVAKLNLIEINLPAAPSECDLCADRQHVVVVVDRNIIVVHAYLSRMNGKFLRDIVSHLRDAANTPGCAADEDLPMEADSCYPHWLRSKVG